MLIKMEVKTVNKNGLNLSKIFSVFLCAVSLFFVIISVAVSIIAYSPKARLFGYNFYVSEADVLGTEIEKNALIISKDENLTSLSLENDYVIIKKLGGFIKNEGAWFLITLSALPIAFFLIVILSESKKAMQKYGEKRLNLELEFKETEEEENISA